MVRHRPGALRGDDRRCCATTACSSATATRSRRSASCCCCCRACPASARRSTAPTSASRLGPLIVPAGRVREDRDRRLPGQLPARHAPAARASARGASLGITIPPLKHFGPLLVVWGAAMVMLVLHPRPRLVADVLRRLPRDALRGDQPASRSSLVGLALFALGAWVLYHARPTITTASTPGSTRSTRALRQASAAATSSRSRCSRRPTAGSSARASARRCSNGRRRRRCCPRAQTDLIYAVIVNELGLDRRVRRALHLPAGRRARLQDRHARARLVLQAAGHRADGGLRAAGLRDRRRRHQGDPADRRDAAVHLLRRLVDPRELRAARAAAAGLRPRAARGAEPR